MEFSDEFQTTDLELLSKTSPQLKHLIIHRTEGFTGTFTGSRLEELDIRGGLSLSFYEGEYHNMFPLSSASSLTRLSIIYSEGNGADDAVKKGLFDAFINLNSFCISPMSNGISDFLIRANIRLINFSTMAIIECREVTREMFDMDKFLSIFSADSFRDIEELRLSFDPYVDEWREYYPRFIEKISTLRSLEGLFFCIDLNTSWYKTLSRLTNLKKLYWYILDEGNHPDAPARVSPDETEYKQWIVERGIKVTEECAKEFEGFKKLPLIHVEFMEDYNYDELWHDHGSRALITWDFSPPGVANLKRW